ncbi:glycoside hydrolase family 88 protein [Polaribacter aquimarinus]|uniref:Glucuronyl hydrolase n=1 Tax=Polaribacter aquimarinus TaxID=2100726 RepID=A0A2U2J892_9FLAO|nr:glycoside hydrolase family 88 protein [Polaribacter aquimarinus]PWG04550.1 glucuronyl hydrolase [Polaribacter aquimarinus]
MRNIFKSFLLFSLFFLGCKSEKKEQFNPDKALEKRFSNLLEYQADSLSFPRSYSFEKKQVNKVPSKDWTSGFYAGNLWQLFEITNNTKYKDLAKKWTSFIEKEKYNNRTHDMGFKVFCSFGQGLKHIENQNYKDIIIKSSQTLITRYNDTIKSIRSWDFNKEIWKFPVIIDNMMNLEMLFEATKISGDSVYHKIAVTHANTTLKNHFRKDNSTFHVLDYSPKTGKVRMKVTHQGYNDNSVWARGQGWAIYGYTMAYRYTKDKKYLNQAEATANFYLSHKNLPEDGIPFWDFNAPNIPNEPRDVSAGTVISSALVELYKHTNNTKYLEYSKKVINTLKSENYILPESLNAPFILNHSTGNWPKNDEIDEPIVYGDYYFLETLLRLKSL